MKKILLLFAIVLMAAVASAQTKDDHGVIIGVPSNATVETYYRTATGYSWIATYEDVADYGQSGSVDIAFCADGTVYIKDIVCYSDLDSWVKGTISGNKLTIAKGQPLYYDSEYETTINLYCGYYSEETEDIWVKDTSKDIVFTIEERNGFKYISLDNSDEDHYIAPFWADDNSWYGLADCETVFSNNPDDEVEDDFGDDDFGGDEDVNEGNVVIDGSVTTLVNPMVKPNGESESINFSAIGLQNQEDVAQVMMEDGSLLMFDIDEGSNAPKYYDNGAAVRVYKNNAIMFIAVKPIASIVLECVGSNYTGNADAEVYFAGDMATYYNCSEATNVQLRIKSLTINYGDEPENVDGIAEVSRTERDVKAVYDLSGRRVNGMEGMRNVKGIFIVNGKKIIK